MVMLFFSALDHQANQRDFHCALTSLEANLDVLSSLVAKGHTLLTAYVIEDNVRTNLPLAAFDGSSFSTEIQALETEWLTVLKKPSTIHSVHKEELIGLIRKRINNLEEAVLTYEQMSDRFSRLIKRTQEGTMAEPRRSLLIHRYERQLINYKAYLHKVYFHKKLSTDRLNELMKT